MPLKYLAEIDWAVSLAGWAHGILFLMVCFATSLVWLIADWKARRALLVIGAALIPFGPFMIDGYLRREQQRASCPDQ